MSDKDTIYRQDAINAVKDRYYKYGRFAKKEELVWSIEKLPSAQSEIIHCKDCKFYGRVDKRRFYRGSDCLNNHIDTIVPDKDFCSRAEKRGEADDDLGS